MPLSSEDSESPGASSASSPQPIVHVYPYGECPIARGADSSSTAAKQSSSSSVEYSHSKVLHVVRHAQGHHNVDRDYRSMANLDARLTEHGIQQCQQLAERIQNAHPESALAELASSLQLVVTSPLTRCMQTALLSLQPVLAAPPESWSSSLENNDSKEQQGQQERRDRDADNNIAVVAHEMIRETVNYNCDRRRHVDELRTEFGHQVDFSELETNHDSIWQAYVETLGDHDEYTAHRESGELHVVAQRGRSFFEWLAQRPETHVLVCSHAAFLRCLWNFGLSEEIPMQPPQTLDKRADRTANHPVVQFMGGGGNDDDDFEKSLRETYENCEIRSMVIAFPK